MSDCQWLYRLEEGQESWWGKEAILLAGTSRSGAAVAPAFVVSTKVYADFFTSAKVARGVKKACVGLSARQPQHFAAAAKQIRSLILAAPFSATTKQSLANYFKELQKQLLIHKGIRLVLSSGEQSISQVVHTSLELEKAIKQLYSLAFTERDIFFRYQEKVSVIPEAMPVLVEYVQQPEFSGVGYCHDRENHDDTTIEIKAWHFQRPTLNKLTLEDTYRLDKKSLALLSREVSKQWWADSGDGKFVSPLHLGKSDQTLTDEQIEKLARQIKLAQSQFNQVMHFEWAYAHKQFWITRVRVMDDCCLAPQAVEVAPEGPRPLFIGLSGALGWASGPVRLVKNKKDREKFQAGEIAVVEQLVPEDYTWLTGAAGLIAEVGSSHSAEGLVAKRLGIPAVVGLGSAYPYVKTGQMVTVDGTEGMVYPGKVNRIHGGSQYRSSLPPTGTKILTTVLHPYDINAEELRHCDGIGLLRGEFILGLLGTHPEDIIRKGLQQEYSDVLAEGLEGIMRSVYPRSVIYQLHDITTMDLLGLGGRQRDRHEPNPALGYRGAHRLLAEPEVLDLELEALEQIASHGISNFAIMIPMTRSLQEVSKLRHYIEHSKLARQGNVDIWVKCETPGLLLQIDDLCRQEIAGVCFDVSSLSQFMQGIDKENRQIAHHLDHTDSAVERGLSVAIAKCRAAGVASMVVAEREELRPETVQTAVEAGVTSISVMSSQVEPLHGLVAAVEQKMLLNKMIEEKIIS